MAAHERKTQQNDLRPAQERQLLSVDQPKQQTVFKRDIGHREERRRDPLKDVHKGALHGYSRLATKIHDLVKHAVNVDTVL